MAIQFDHSNLLAAVVGEENGLTPAEIQEATPAATDALHSFRRSYASGGYGFPDLPTQTETAKAILKYTAKMRGTFDTVCLIGIGGSALGAWALDCGLRGPHPVQPPFSNANPRLVILDNVDPTFVMGALESMQPKKTLAVVVAKSGSTAETISTFLIVREWLSVKLGRKAAEHIAVVTSAGKGDLKQLATAEQYETFHLPDNVGGRFSVLSAVGLLPAALIGLDVRKILKGAAAMTETSWLESPTENIALRAAMVHHLIWTRKRKPIQVAFPYSNRLWGTAFWFRQLWAESLGKAKNRKDQTVNMGQTPIAALGTTDQHSQVQLYMEGPNDKIYSFWAVGRHRDVGRIPKVKTGYEGFDYLAGQSLAKLIDAERRATEAALTQNKRPNCTYTVDRVDEENLGAFLQMMEFQTAFMGELLDINAFDQEGVELGKKFTFALMGRKGYDEFSQRFKKYEHDRTGAARA
jgi:glucose-6-phosphate isomerase